MSLVLDVGCGDNETFRDNWHRDAIGVDIRPCKRERFVLANVEERLPFEDGSVAKVYLFDVIEHLDAPGKALAEIHRVLKPGGELELGTPNCLYIPKVVMSAFKGRYAPHKDHVATYGLPELKERLQRSGFRDIRIELETYVDDQELQPLWHRAVVWLCPFPSLRARQLRAWAKK